MKNISKKYRIIKGNIFSTIMIASGIMVLFPFFLVLLIQAPDMVEQFLFNKDVNQLSWLMVYLIFICFGVVSTILGLRLKGRTKRFQRYTTAIGQDEFVRLEDLAEISGKSLTYVKKDIWKMIQSHWFVDVYLDNKKNRLIFGQQNYMALVNGTLMEVNEWNELDGMDAHTASLIKEGKQILSQIQTIQYRINTTKIARSLDDIANTTDKIFDYVSQHPQKVNEIGKFLRYYLPTMIKLLTAYEKMTVQQLQGTNVKQSMEKIERSFQTIAKAFEQLLDNLFHDEALDIATDIDVLEQVLRQEGLTKEMGD